MTMQTATLFDAFVKAGVEPSLTHQALENLHVEIRKEVDSRYQAHANVLFTKSDGNALRSEMKADMAEMKAELIRWMVGTMFAAATLAVAVGKLIH